MSTVEPSRLNRLTACSPHAILVRLACLDKAVEAVDHPQVEGCVIDMQLPTVVASGDIGLKHLRAAGEEFRCISVSSIDRAT